MTPEEHQAIARRFFEEVWNQQEREAIDVSLLQQLGQFAG